MYYTIKKRDGRSVPFDAQKIKDAVIAAFKDVDGEVTEYAEQKAQNIADYIYGYMEGVPNELTIDDIQTLVEHGLMSCKRKDVATSYIEYRHDRDQVRKWNNQMMDAMAEKLQGTRNDRQNANVDEESFGGRKGEAHAIIDKQYALDCCMSKKSRQRHLNNEIYIHDLDNYSAGMHNCLTIPFDDLLANGFNTRQTDVRPANSISTAFQLVAVIFQLQSLQQFGGVSASHLDWTMVPYVRKSFYKHYMNGMRWFSASRDSDMELHMHSHYENEGWKEFFKNEPIDSEKYQEDKLAYEYAMEMTIKETQQAVEGMYHNLK